MIGNIIAVTVIVLFIAGYALWCVLINRRNAKVNKIAERVATVALLKTQIARDRRFYNDPRATRVGVVLELLEALFTHPRREDCSCSDCKTQTV